MLKIKNEMGEGMINAFDPALFTPAQIEWLNERAGILEFEAGFDRETAEKNAIGQLRREERERAGE